MKLFFRVKIGIEKCMSILIFDIKARYGTSMKFARCDNTRDNEDFERACKQEVMSV